MPQEDNSHTKQEGNRGQGAKVEKLVHPAPGATPPRELEVLKEGYKSAGDQGISLQPVGSPDTNPFMQQPSTPPDSSQSNQPSGSPPASSSPSSSVSPREGDGGGS